MTIFIQNYYNLIYYPVTNTICEYPKNTAKNVDVQNNFLNVISFKYLLYMNSANTDPIEQTSFNSPRKDG